MESHSVVMKGERIMVKYHNLMQCVAKNQNKTNPKLNEPNGSVLDEINWTFMYIWGRLGKVWCSTRKCNFDRGFSFTFVFLSVVLYIYINSNVAITLRPFKMCQISH